MPIPSKLSLAPDVTSFAQNSQQFGSVLNSGYALFKQAYVTEGIGEQGQVIQNLTHRLQQIFLWALVEEISNPISTEMAFIPLFFGGFNSVVYSFKEQDNSNSTIPKKGDINTLNMSPTTTIIQTDGSPATISTGTDSFTDINTITEDPVTKNPYIPYVYIIYKENKTAWKSIKLRATIGHQKLTQSINNTWNGYSSFGKTQKNYVYVESDRTLPISLYEYATSKDQVDSLYAKLLALTQVNYGQYAKVTGGGTMSLLHGNVIYITIGGLYENIPAIINNMNFEFDENYWYYPQESRASLDTSTTSATGTMYYANPKPTIVKIDMNLTLLTQGNPSGTYLDFYSDTIDYTQTTENK